MRVAQGKKTRKPKCLACGKLISGRPQIMRLKITSEENRLILQAKDLGFTSSTWKEGDYLQGYFDRKCFAIAKLTWQVAFNTRLLSPRQ